MLPLESIGAHSRCVLPTGFCPAAQRVLSGHLAALTSSPCSILAQRVPRQPCSAAGCVPTPISSGFGR